MPDALALHVRARDTAEREESEILFLKTYTRNIRVILLVVIMLCITLVIFAYISGQQAGSRVAEAHRLKVTMSQL